MNDNGSSEPARSSVKGIASLVKRYVALTPNARIGGIDEAGRGPLAGPLVVAAVILDPRRSIAGIDDSKRLSARRREACFARITEHALAFHIETIDVASIDALNIFHATMEGMQRCAEALSDAADSWLIDGNAIPPGLRDRARAVVQGDALEPAIAAASILAKVHRDRLLDELDRLHPEYGFGTHKGYPTAAHLHALRERGPCPAHRRSFAPVRVLLESDDRNPSPFVLTGAPPLRTRRATIPRI